VETQVFSSLVSLEDSWYLAQLWKTDQLMTIK